MIGIKLLLQRCGLAKRLFASALLALCACADSFGQVPSWSLSPDERNNTWILGIGGANVLDTYLSPNEYTGTSAMIAYDSEMGLPWQNGKWSLRWNAGLEGVYLASPTDDGKEWNADILAGVACLRNWNVLGLRLAVGPMLGFETGFTYNTRNGNNPAQGKASAYLGVLGKAEYGWLMFGHEFKASVTADMPLAGAMFTPNYGQSYYEIFSLGHYDKNIRFTHPANAPSFGIRAMVGARVGKSVISLGYDCRVRQSDVNNLKRHNWNNSFIIGFTRNFRLL